MPFCSTQLRLLCQCVSLHSFDDVGSQFNQCTVAASCCHHDVWLVLLCNHLRLYVKSDIESQLSAQQASSLTAQLAAAQASVERLAGQWQAAEAAKEALIRAANRRAEQATTQVVERLQQQVWMAVLPSSPCYLHTARWSPPASCCSVVLHDAVC